MDASSDSILQHSNTPTLQHSNTPTLQHSNTPTLQSRLTALASLPPRRVRGASGREHDEAADAVDLAVVLLNAADQWLNGRRHAVLPAFRRGGHDHQQRPSRVAQRAE